MPQIDTQGLNTVSVYFYTLNESLISFSYMFINEPLNIHSVLCIFNFEKRHFHWKVETCRFRPVKKHLTSCQKYHQSMLTLPGDAMLPVRSTLKTQIPEHFIWTCPRNPGVGEPSGRSPWNLPEKGRHLQIHCLMCRQTPGCCQCLPSLKRVETQTFRCPICRFGPRVSDSERVALLLRWGTRGQMSPASQSASQDSPLERQRPYVHRPFFNAHQMIQKKFLLQA